jgi:beta-glucosidase
VTATTDSPAGLPDGFLWGASTSAYQVEGAISEDGRAPSIWDRFSATPGKIRNGDTGATACDFYHRHPEDVALMRELGLDAFRFSISWPRILPEGRGRVNEAGLDFYDRLVDELLEAGIRPYPTLYHWDLPQALEELGGWPSRPTAAAFAEYVEVVAERLGDRVTAWTTHNEPFCSSWLGYGVGLHAPGRAEPGDGLAAVHHVLLSHGLAVDVLRRTCPQAQVGIVLDSWPVHAASDDERDREAARRADALRNRLFFDAVLRGEYMWDVFDRFGSDGDFVRDRDLEAIAAPVDFVGVNNYSRAVVAADPETGDPVEAPPAGVARTGLGWEVYPDGLREVLTRLHRDYGVQALYVTENGAAYPDVRGLDGEVHDPERVEYLDRYIGAVACAIEDGIPVRGYFVWSLLDNFEWTHGYAQRFGVVYVDYETLERVPKSSFYWYRDRIAAARSAELARAATAAGS